MGDSKEDNETLRVEGWRCIIVYMYSMSLINWQKWHDSS